MNIAKLTDDEKKYLESEEKKEFKLQKYEVSTSSLRWCDARGIKPVVFLHLVKLNVMRTMIETWKM